MILIQQVSSIVIISKFGKNIKKKHCFRPRQASTSPRAGSCCQNQYFCPLERDKYAGQMAEEQKELDDLKALIESQQDTLSQGMSAMTTKAAVLLEKLDRKVELSCLANLENHRTEVKSRTSELANRSIVLLPFDFYHQN